MSTPPADQGSPEPDRHEPPPEHYDDPVLLEEDETIPPRPEEELADRLRSEPAP